MNKPTPKWIDADAHVTETAELWERLDKQFRSRVELIPMTDDPVLSRTPVGMDVHIDGKPVPMWASGSRKHRFDRFLAQFRTKYPSLRSGFDPEQYVADMNSEGMDKVVIYPTLFLFAPWIPSIGAPMGTALARAYNDWIHDFCAIAPNRMFPAAVVSFHDVDQAVAEVQRCAKRGFMGVFVRPNPFYGRTLAHPDYDRFWAACEDAQMTVGIHEGGLSYLPTLGADRVRHQDMLHAMAHPFEQMAAMAALYEGEIFARHPKLNFLFLEGGTGLWVPYWLNRLDAERRLPHRAHVSSEMLLPSQYFERQCWATCEVDDPYLPQLLSMTSDTKFLFSTDYPHMESPFPNSVREFMNANISDQSRARIGTSNAYDAYPRLPKS